MANPLGSFIWYELMTTDSNAAAEFYGAVIGWNISAGQPGAMPHYRMIGRSDGGANGGVLQLDDEMQAKGARPAWVPYFYVPDVDAAVAAIHDDGGATLMPKTTIPQGSFAMVTDPQGVPFYVMTPVPPAGTVDATSDVFSTTEAQHVRWNELASPDLAAAKEFYSRHFDFEFNNVMPMGEMGDYCFIDHHGVVLGAIMQQAQAGQPAMWLPYIGVPGVMQAKAAIEENGGTIMNGPHEVPGGDWIIVARDPQGAAFGVVGPQGE